MTRTLVQDLEAICRLFYERCGAGCDRCAAFVEAVGDIPYTRDGKLLAHVFEEHYPGGWAQWLEDDKQAAVWKITAELTLRQHDTSLRQFLTARRADLPPPFHKNVDVLLRSLKPGFEDAVTEIDRASREQ